MQINLNEQDQLEIEQCITKISNILIAQFEKGVEQPTISGNVSVCNEDLKLSFFMQLIKFQK